MSGIITSSMKEFIEVATVIEMIVGNVFALLLMAIIIFAVSYIASKLKTKHKNDKYEVKCLGDVYWVIKIVDAPKYYSHKKRAFSKLRFASKYDSEQLAYLNMANLK